MRKADSFEGQRMIVLPKNLTKDLSNNNLTKNLFVTDIGYFPRAKGHFRERKQGSDENILILCKKGKGIVEIDKNINSLTKDQFIIISKGKSHRYFADTNEPWSIYWVHFTGELSHYFTSNNTTQTITNFTNPDIDPNIQLFDELYSTLEAGFNVNNLEYSSILLSHLLGSLKYNNQYPAIKNYNNQDNVTRAIQFMKANLDRILNLSEIANAGNLSVSQISLRFKKQTDKAPLEYFTFLKIQKACNYLSLTDKKVKTIAHDLGYQDAYYFSRVFTKTMGVSPTNYRQKAQHGFK